MDREIRLFSASTSMIFTVTSWPSLSTSSGLVDAAVGNLRNVNQAVHAGNDLGNAPKVISFTILAGTTSPTEN